MWKILWHNIKGIVVFISDYIVLKFKHLPEILKNNNIMLLHKIYWNDAGETQK